MRWIVAQLGARQHYAIPNSFQELGHLKLVYTEAWCRWGSKLIRRGPRNVRAFANRFHPALPPSKVKSFTPSYAAFHLRHFPRPPVTREQLYRFFLKAGAWFGERVSKHLARQTLDSTQDHFFAFNTSALETLHHLRQRGIFTVIDQIDPGSEEERLVALERERWPGWEEATDPIPDDYWARIRAEWELADIVLVNSEWSKALLMVQGVPEAKIIVVPLAYEPPQLDPAPKVARNTLIVLWLGTVNLRKGIPYLLEAAKLLPKVKFLVAGPIGIHPSRVESAPTNMTFLGRIQRDELTKIYDQADVFVLPTISDGFAITQLEAMAHGLPVITTPNCGRVVTDGYDGLIVPAGNSEALAAAIARLDANRKELLGMSRQAIAKAHAYELPRNSEEIEQKVTQFKAASRNAS